MHALVGTVETEDDSEYIRKRSNGSEWFVDGRCPMHDFLSFFDSEELYESNDYTTVAGLCLQHLGHIPSEGEWFIWHNFRFEISDMDGARIDKLVVQLISTDDEE